jgi:transcriptional regulator with XRE-family HTH domain
MTATSTLEPAFGALLRRLRVDAGLTQRELSDRSGVSVRAISDLERGINRSARRDTVVMLADGLGLTAAARWDLVETARRAAPAWDRRRPRREHPDDPTVPLNGRDADVRAAINLLIRPDVRLLTLIGPGGIGKTRLALANATRCGPAFADGVRVVHLASITDPGCIAAAIAHVVGVREAAGQPLRTALADELRDKRMLLVLDNCDQIIAAAPFVDELLAACPGLKILVSSRSVLGLPSERTFAVPPPVQ